MDKKPWLLDRVGTPLPSNSSAIWWSERVIVDFVVWRKGSRCSVAVHLSIVCLHEEVIEHRAGDNASAAPEIRFESRESFLVLRKSTDNSFNPVDFYGGHKRESNRRHFVARYNNRVGRVDLSWKRYRNDVYSKLSRTVKMCASECVFSARIPPHHGPPISHNKTEKFPRNRERCYPERPVLETDEERLRPSRIDYYLCDCTE